MWACCGERTVYCTLCILSVTEPHYNPSNAGVSVEKTSQHWQLMLRSLGATLSLATGHLVTEGAGHTHKHTTQSDRCQGASLLIIQHTWDTLIGLGFSCDNQGLAAYLYLSMAVSQRGVLGSGGRNCLLCWKGPLCLQYLCDGVPSHTHTPGHCSVVPVLSRGPL